MILPDIWTPELVTNQGAIVSFAEARRREACFGPSLPVVPAFCTTNGR